MPRSQSSPSLLACIGPFSPSATATDLSSPLLLQSPSRLHLTRSLVSRQTKKCIVPIPTESVRLTRKTGKQKHQIFSGNKFEIFGNWKNPANEEAFAQMKDSGRLSFCPAISSSVRRKSNPSSSRPKSSPSRAEKEEEGGPRDQAMEKIPPSSAPSRKGGIEEESIGIPPFPPCVLFQICIDVFPAISSSFFSAKAIFSFPISILPRSTHSSSYYLRSRNLSPSRSIVYNSSCG